MQQIPENRAQLSTSTVLVLILGFFSIKGNKMLKASERIKIRFYRNRAFHLPGGSISWAQALPFLKSPGLPNFYCREASPPFNAFLFFI